MLAAGLVVLVTLVSICIKLKGVRRRKRHRDVYGQTYTGERAPSPLAMTTTTTAADVPCIITGAQIALVVVTSALVLALLLTGTRCLSDYGW